MSARLRTAPLTSLTVAAVAVFLLACMVIPGGLLRGGHYGDVTLYAHDAKLVVAGKIPYRDFTLEYPPGSLAAFLPPAVSEAHYTELFRLLMALCGTVALRQDMALLFPHRQVNSIESQALEVLRQSRPWHFRQRL